MPDAEGEGQTAQQAAAQPHVAKVVDGDPGDILVPEDPAAPASGRDAKVVFRDNQLVRNPREQAAQSRKHHNEDNRVHGAVEGKAVDGPEPAGYRPAADRSPCDGDNKQQGRQSGAVPHRQSDRQANLAM